MGGDAFDGWQHRVDAVWQDRGLSDDERVIRIDALAGELGEDHPVALFERAGARDSAGHETEAEPLYRRAIERGLDDARRTRATIQLASTIRNLGKVDEALELLEAERLRGSTALRDELAAFTALTLVSAGEPVRAASVALSALAPHLTLYTRSVSGYAAELVDD
ncbi:tetratricopeptide repeat protein [Microbacterium marinilacus]|uniref:Tetratricopeptide repeat protein n=1 Tax=Microbacterium marinilacus TaxID=415209 RepID=A0ABP7B3T2_9MICO|nr:tetratricopeptide repeat protein [Microbacterium marinilacus]MBY0688539.1 tetratricopeptide repeat protein [Microbacterium marinilacus]